MSEVNDKCPFCKIKRLYKSLKRCCICESLEKIYKIESTRYPIFDYYCKDHIKDGQENIEKLILATQKYERRKMDEKGLTFEGLQASTAKLIEYEKNFRRQISELWGIKVIVDDSLPHNSWHITCSRDYYNDVMNITDTRTNKPKEGI